MKKWIFGLVACLVLTIGSIHQLKAAKPQAAHGRTQWEYYILYSKHINDYTFNNLGLDGWELVGISNEQRATNCPTTTTFYFKRLRTD
jgi:hypothetical protein